MLETPPKLDDLWAALDEAALADERIPYWAELWPSSMAVAELLWRRREDIAGACCVDLGCGLGFTALAGQFLGAKVLACDYFADALMAGKRNSALNGHPGGEPQWLIMDWRAPALVKGCASKIWAADILYEKRSFEPVLRFLDHVLAPGGAAWIGEPGRGLFTEFKLHVQNCGWSLEPALQKQTDGIHAGQPAATITVWQMERM